MQMMAKMKNSTHQQITSWMPNPQAIADVLIADTTNSAPTVAQENEDGKDN